MRLLYGVRDLEFGLYIAVGWMLKYLPKSVLNSINSNFTKLSRISSRVNYKIPKCTSFVPTEAHIDIKLLFVLF